MTLNRAHLLLTVIFTVVFILGGIAGVIINSRVQALRAEINTLDARLDSALDILDQDIEEVERRDLHNSAPHLLIVKSVTDNAVVFSDELCELSAAPRDELPTAEVGQEFVWLPASGRWSTDRTLAGYNVR